VKDAKNLLQTADALHASTFDIEITDSSICIKETSWQNPSPQNNPSRPSKIQLHWEGQASNHTYL